MRSSSLHLEHLHTAARLWTHPRASREEVARFRDRKLRVLVAHAQRNVPLYRRLIADAGVSAADVRGAADLVRLPVTTKALMRATPVRDLLAAGTRAESLLLRYTTGSTGEPARIRRSELEDHLLNLFRVRAVLLAGGRLRDRRVSVTSRGVPTDHKPSPRKRLAKRLGLFHCERVDCLQPIADVAREVRALAPDIVGGYPAVLTEIAGLWRSLPGEDASPRLVTAGGETLTPAMRARIERGFGTKVIGLYGCHEANMLGWECAETGDFHLCDDNAIVEVLHDGRPAAPGETGDVVITALHSYAAPFIRYDLGDVATRGDDACRCGAPFSTLRDLHGRRMDYCVLPDGSKLHHWDVIPMSFWDMRWHRRYQLVQETRERFALRVVADERPPSADLAALSSAIERKLGPRASFRIELVADIALSATGKHRLCRSELGAVSPVTSEDAA